MPDSVVHQPSRPTRTARTIRENRGPWLVSHRISGPSDSRTLGTVRVYFILDELTVAPGRLAEVRDRVEREYLPGAVERGLTLEQTLVSPVELHDAPNQVLFLWSFPDAAAYWAARSGANRDPAVTAFWDALDRDLVSRTRRVFGSENP